MSDKRILVDTSVWIKYFKNPSEEIAEKVDELLDQESACTSELVIAELIWGAKSEKEVSVIEKLAKTLAVLRQTEKSWHDSGILSYKLKKLGITISLLDCYIAVIASENNCSIFTLDKHFETISKHQQLELIEM